MTGAEFKQMRETLAMKQRDAAIGAGRTIRQVRRWENAETVPAVAVEWISRQRLIGRTRSKK